MAQVKIEDIVYHLDNEFRLALQDALQEVARDSRIDATALFQAFHRAVYRRCSTWENVPDQYVKN